MGSIFLPVVHGFCEKYDRYVRTYHSQQVVHTFYRVFSLQSNQIYLTIVQSVFRIQFGPRLCVMRSYFSGLFAGYDPTRGSSQEGLKMSWVGSGRVGSEGVRNVTGRVGSIPVNKF